MQSVRFGLVKQIQFVDPQGQPVSACGLDQALNTQGARAQPAYSVFTLGGAYCGDPDSQHYLVINGPHDADGDTFSRDAKAINDKYVAQLPLDEQKRESLIAEKTALFQTYLAKLSGTLTVKVKPDNTFEF